MDAQFWSDLRSVLDELDWALGYAAPTDYTLEAANRLRSALSASHNLPIRVPCEGSDLRTRDPSSMHSGECVACGVVVTTRDDGSAFPHERNDVEEMARRGDFA